MTPEQPFTLGAHNLHDEAGVPTFFADVVVFSEAIAPTIKAKARQKVAHAQARLAGYSIAVCAQQRDLVIAFRRKRFRIKSRSYTQYVKGDPHVTPNRGTFLLFLVDRSTGDPWVIVAEHRINAAFPPYVRSDGDPAETAFRVTSWRVHTAGTLSSIDRVKATGFRVAAAGDLNTPRHVSGYQGHLVEMGGDILFDRLGSTEPLSAFEVLTRAGSDHHRIRATVHPRRSTHT